MKYDDPILSRPDAVQRITPDDEIVGHGAFHMERMSDGHIWFVFAGEAYDLSAHRGKLIWQPQSPVWPEVVP